MGRQLQTISSMAPCRVCLFGEHQDYLGFPVIAASIPMFVEIQGILLSLDDDDDNQDDSSPSSRQQRRIIELTIPMISDDTPQVYNLDDLPDARQVLLLEEGNNPKPDFALAALQECQGVEGWQILPPGRLLRLTSTVTNDLPMQAGCSTSSAFVVAFLRILAWLSGQTQLLDDDPTALAQLAFRAEVTHFGAPGGTMDHIACSVGGILRIGPEMWRYEHLLANRSSSYAPAVLLLADSGEPKDTWTHLYRCKQARINLLHEKLNGDWDNYAAAIPNSGILSSDEQVLLQATLTNRYIEQEAHRILQQINQCNPEDDDDRAAIQLWQQVGELMNRHHAALRDALRLSTDRLEAIRSVALRAGAWGFKVVGSGGGGCGVALAPAAQAGTIRDAMLREARRVWIIPAPGPSPALTVQ
jgi:galactokinase